MSTVTASQFAQACAQQRALTDSEWLGRCDELAEQQRVLFLELLSFARDGASEAQARSLLDFLSVLQIIAAVHSGSAAAPVEIPEFRAAIERAGHFFLALKTDDRPHFDRMIRAWHEGVALQSEPVIWAGCVETLGQHGILSSPLMQGMVVTLYAIADVFSRRLAGQPPPPHVTSAS